METKAEKDDLKDLYLQFIVLGLVICSTLAYCAGYSNKQKELQNKTVIINKK